MNKIALSCENLCRTFGSKEIKTEVLRNVNLQIEAQERIAIIGASGSGKSTLLHLLGGLDSPNSGSIKIANKDIVKMNNRKIAQFRNRHLGFIYQFHHLLPEFTSLENVAMPLWIGNCSSKNAKKIAAQMLEKVGLKDRLKHMPSELSGGERQRVAIARALVNKPYIILADEPTGNLDDDSANQVFDLMNELNINSGTTLIMVTHNKSLALKMDRVLKLSNKTL